MCYTLLQHSPITPHFLHALFCTSAKILSFCFGDDKCRHLKQTCPSWEFHPIPDALFYNTSPSWMQVQLNSNAFRLSELLSCILLRGTDFTCLCNLCTFFLLSPSCHFLQRPLNVNPVTKLPFMSWSLSLKLTFFFHEFFSLV